MFSTFTPIATSVTLLFVLVQGQLPNAKPTYQMNLSTIIMPCNYTGFTDPSTTKGWGVIDFDWSNAKAFWAQAKPMDCSELLAKQVEMTTAAHPETKVWVYRNSIKALPWYTTVREKLTDPAYAPWHMFFAKNVTPHVPVCDTNYNPPLCSDMYHDQSQTPGYPTGDGNCASPACDVGSVPVGEYLWDPRAWNTSVKGQTFGEWFINDYVFDATGGANPKVSGFYFDDDWDMRGPSEYEEHVVQDLGLSRTDLAEMMAAYNSNMAQVYEAVLTRGKFSWQQFYAGQLGNVASTTPTPLIRNNITCALDLRRFCTPPGRDIVQSRFLMYAFSPGGGNPGALELLEFEQDLANFLLVRGPYAVLGHGWLGCSNIYTFPDALNLDYGEPTEFCHETAPNSGVFVRQWTKAEVSMDCNTWTPTITIKP